MKAEGADVIVALAHSGVDKSGYNVGMEKRIVLFNRSSWCRCGINGTFTYGSEGRI